MINKIWLEKTVLFDRLTNCYLILLFLYFPLNWGTNSSLSILLMTISALLARITHLIAKDAPSETEVIAREIKNELINKGYYDETGKYAKGVPPIGEDMC